MSKPSIKIPRTNAERKREALAAAGVPPSEFGRRRPAQPHRDRKQAVARGERKHKRPWG